MTNAQSRALSSMGYFFLRMVFEKEDYPESVVNELEWIADELVKEYPDSDLLSAITKEICEGAYLDGYVNPYASLEKILHEYYKFSANEIQRIIDTLKKCNI